MLVTPFNHPDRLGSASTRPQGLACLGKPEQRQRLAQDMAHYLSLGHAIQRLPDGCVEDPVTLGDYAESDVLLMIHGGRLHG